MAESERRISLVLNDQGRGPSEGLRRVSDSEQSERTRLKILVVDDVQLLADTTVQILAGFGFDTRATYDGESGLRTAVSFQPDILLTDVLMPRMNGVDLAIVIRKQLPATRILLFSGQAGITELLQRGREQGYEFELVAKPIHPMRLVERIRKMETE